MPIAADLHFGQTSDITSKKLEVSQRNIDVANKINQHKVQTDDVRVSNTEHIITKASVKINEFLRGSVLSASAKASNLEIKADKYKDIESIISKPEREDGVQNLINQVYKALEATRDLSNQDLRKSTVATLKNAATTLSEKASSLYNISFELNQNISNDITETNNLIKGIADLRYNMLVTQDDVLRANLENDINDKFHQLSQYIPITTYKDRNGLPSAILKTTQNEVELFDLGTTYRFDYPGIPSVDSIENDKLFPPLLLKQIALNGYGALPTTIVTGGKSADVENYLTHGSIASKIEMIHKHIPNFLDMLDQLALQLQTSLNSAHNAGTSYLPASELTATRTASYDTKLNVSGQVTVALLDSGGQPLKIPQVDGEEFIPALTLDFDKLDFGLGVGKARVQDITSAINQYSDELSKRNRIKLGGLSDIKLISTSEKMQPGVPFNLDLELTNYGLLDLSVRTKNCQIKDSAGMTTVISAPISQYVSGKGTKQATDGTLGFSFIPTTGSYPYEIVMDVEVGDGSKSITRRLTYKIEDPASYNTGTSGFKNMTFSVDSMDGSSSSSNEKPIDTARLLPPLLDRSPLVTGLLDSDGIQIDDDNLTKLGSLSFRSNNHDWHFVIDQSASSVSGKTGNDDEMMNVKFNEFFGMNDILVRNDKDSSLWHTQRNAALNMKVRDDISKNYRLFSTGKLQKFREYPEDTTPITSMQLYTVGSGDNSNANDMISAMKSNQVFKQRNGQNTWIGDIMKYSQHIVFTVAQETRDFIISAKTEKDNVNGLRQEVARMSGISKANEMTDIIGASETFNYQLSATQKALETIDNFLRVIGRVGV